MSSDGWMDKLQSLGSEVANAAPMLGSALAGPGGGAVGSLVASAFGAKGDDPEAVANAIRQDPEAAAKLKKIEAENEAEIKKVALENARHRVAQETEKIEAVNKTMRAEAKSEHFLTYSWRPIWGYLSAAAFFLTVPLFAWLAYEAVAEGNADAMQMIPQLLTGITTLFGIPGAILGISAHHRGRKQRAEAGEPLGQGMTGKALQKARELVSGGEDKKTDEAD